MFIFDSEERLKNDIIRAEPQERIQDRVLEMWKTSRTGSGILRSECRKERRRVHVSI
jgi:hypothetical protein